jgi:hypothetical protein
MLAADTYADYDGYTVYTTKRASKAPQPKWSDLTADYMLGVRACCAPHVWRTSSPAACSAVSATRLACVMLHNYTWDGSCTHSSRSGRRS